MITTKRRGKTSLGRTHPLPKKWSGLASKSREEAEADKAVFVTPGTADRFGFPRWMFHVPPVVSPHRAALLPHALSLCLVAVSGQQSVTRARQNTHRHSPPVRTETLCECQASASCLPQHAEQRACPQHRSAKPDSSPEYNRNESRGEKAPGQSQRG